MNKSIAISTCALAIGAALIGAWHFPFSVQDSGETTALVGNSQIQQTGSVEKTKTTWVAVSETQSDTSNTIINLDASTPLTIDVEAPATLVASEFENAVENGQPLAVHFSDEEQIELVITPADSPLADNFQLTALQEGAESPVSIDAPKFFTAHASASVYPKEIKLTQATFVKQNGDFHGILKFDDGSLSEVYREPGTPHYVAKRYNAELMSKLDSHMLDNASPKDFSHLSNTLDTNLDAHTTIQTLDMNFNKVSGIKGAASAEHAQTNPNDKEFRGMLGAQYRQSLSHPQAFWLIQKRYFTPNLSEPVTQQQFRDRYRRALSWLLYVNRWFENQIGYNYQAIEIVTALDDSPTYPPGYGVGAWARERRPNLKIDIATNVKGIGGGGFSNGNSNWVSDFVFLPHEHEHDFGAGHCSTFGSHSLFRPCGNAPYTRDHRMKASKLYSSARHWSSTPTRDPEQAPYAVDDNYYTPVNTPITFDPSLNDVKEQHWNPNRWRNDTLTIVETGAVFPPESGQLQRLNGNQLTFVPSPTYEGSVKFSYTVKGSVGNNGKGWLHAGYVTLTVGKPSVLKRDFSFEKEGSSIRTQADHLESYGKPVSFNPLGNDIGLGGNLIHRVTANKGVFEGEVSDKYGVGFHVINVKNLTPEKGTLEVEKKVADSGRHTTTVYTGNMTFTPFAGATGTARILYEVRDRNGHRKSDIVHIYLDKAGRPAIQGKTINVSEHELPGTELTSVFNGITGAKYAIKSGNTKNWFSVNPETGVISVSDGAQIKIEQKVKTSVGSTGTETKTVHMNKVNLVVEVTQHSHGVPRRNVASVNIHIAPRQNHPPTIANALPIVIDTGSLSSSPIFNLRAQDKEKDPVTFVQGASSSPFTVNASGAVTLKSGQPSLSAGRYTLPVSLKEARSGGNTSLVNLPIVVTSTSVPNNNGLKAYWSFNQDTVTDTHALDIVSGHHLTLKSLTPNHLVKGRKAESIGLAGKPNYLDLTPHLSHFATLNQGTISLWYHGRFASQTPPKEPQTIFAANSYDNKHSVRLLTHTAGLAYQVFVNGKKITEIQSPIDVTQNGWHHIALANDGSQSVLYVNGKPHTQYKVATNRGAFLSSLPHIDEINIGRTFTEKTWQQAGAYGSGSLYLSGLLDEIKIHSRALTAAEVKKELGKPLLTVIGGNGTGRFEPGTTVSISTDKAGFVSWGGSLDLSQPKAKSTTFVMPAQDVVMEAFGKDQLPARGLLARWEMENKTPTLLKDSGPNQLKSTFESDSGACTTSLTLESGYKGKALAFNGQCYVNMGLTTEKVHPMKNTGSISLWFKPTFKAGSERYQALTSFGAAKSWVGSNLLYLDTHNKTVNYKTQYHDSNGSVTSKSITLSQKVFDDRWHHLLLTSGNRNGTQLYLDGKKVGSLPEAAFMPNDLLSHYYLGFSRTTRKQYRYHGSLDEVSIYNVELSQDEALLLSGERTLQVHGGTPSGAYPPGEAIRIQASSLAGHEFYQWIGDKRDVLDTPNSTFKMGIRDRTLLSTYLGSSYATETGLVARWPLDETSGTSAYESINNKAGTYFKSVSTSVKGIRGNAFLSDGQARQSINITPAVDAFRHLKEGTISGWIKIPADATGYMNLFSASHTSSWCKKTNLSVIRGKLHYIQGCTNSSGYRVVGVQKLNDDQWHHVAVTVSSSGSKLYVDGKLDAQSAYTGFFSSEPNNKANIGIQTSYSNKHPQDGVWKGLIDEVRVYNRVLSSEDLKKLAVNQPVKNGQYYLQVNGGSGSGYYTPGTNVTINAAPQTNMAHVRWIGDTGLLSSSAKTARLTMPAHNLAVSSVVLVHSDKNNNGLADHIELLAGASTDTTDSDGDGLSNSKELALGTHPNKKDSDGDGVNDSVEVNQGSNPLKDDQPPVFSELNDISISSTGAHTAYDFPEVIARDALDGSILATTKQTGPFKPGKHKIIWTAVDHSGNKTTAAQWLNVYPQAQLHRVEHQFMGAKRVKIPVSLTGNSPSYPVRLKLRSLEAGTLENQYFRLSTSEITISAGKTGYFEVELEETLRVSEAKTILLQLETNDGWVKSISPDHSIVMGIYPDDLAVFDHLAPGSPLNVPSTIQNGLKLHWRFDDLSSKSIKNSVTDSGKGILTRRPFKRSVVGTYDHGIALTNNFSVEGDTDTVKLVNELGKAQNYTISLWTKLTKNDQSSYRMLSTSVPYSWCNKLEMASIKGQAAFVVDCPRFDERNILTGKMINDGDWHLLNIVGTPTETRFYVDGQKTNTASGTSNLLADAFAFDLGKTRKGPRDKFNGSMDELMLHNRALTEAEILSLYEHHVANSRRYAPINASIGDIIGETGVILSSGGVSSIHNRTSVLLENDDLVHKGLKQKYPHLKAPTQSVKPLDGTYNIRLAGDSNNSSKVVIPLQMPIQDSSFVQAIALGRESLSWVRIEPNGLQDVRSAPMRNGTCPAPKDATYENGLVAGHQCVEVTLINEESYDLDADNSALEVLLTVSSDNRPNVLRVVNGLGDGYYQSKAYVRVFGRAPKFGATFLGWEQNDTGKLLEANEEVSALSVPNKDSVLFADYQGAVKNTGESLVPDAPLNTPNGPNPNGQGNTNHDQSQQSTQAGGLGWLYCTLLLMFAYVRRNQAFNKQR
ncbi:LamG-like jellyroll fold domain-containing protein [Vibrio nigripulchritudo]|uniref:LamG-like jellyroll fold domain-containing protein n=1 Tax=Vibrio nigripulchritudo TaxID=28173 RepID=UPI0003B1DFF8|nr:LamG-like jellyroll fold domain-containing protein [Vibrio nigripulchritudo]CCN71263.1 exported hypothetical protein [Vibrio nigripulchritudo SFn118]